MKEFIQNVIVGLGPTGLSVAKHLQRQGQSFLVVDNRLNPPGLAAFQELFPAIDCHLGEFDSALLQRAERIILSPGVSQHTEAFQQAKAAGSQLIGDIELFALAATAPIIAITGSNGKSTVTTLVGEMLIAAGKDVLIGGNLGEPALNLLEQAVPDYYVLELSSFQLETTYSLALHAGTITNISEDHLDRYAGDMQAYLAAKQRILRDCRHWVLPFAGESLTAGFKPLHAPDDCAAFSLQSPQAEIDFGVCRDDAEAWLCRGSERIFAVQQMLLQAPHDICNALCALALVATTGASLQRAASCLQGFRGLAHRCQFVAEHNQVRWINDSKGTNVGATLTAIESIAATVPGKVILIAGGQTKGADLQSLQPSIQQYVRTTVLIGEDANKLAKVCVKPQFSHSMQEAVQLAARSAEPGDAVLLSPAAASFDMFANFMQRGDVFTECVHAYIKGQQSN